MEAGGERQSMMQRMTDRRRKTEDWSNRKKESFHISQWPAEGEAKDTVDTLLMIHHGLGEHAGRYERYAQGLASLPLHIWSYDARGHGKSVGPKGHAAGLDGLVDDLEVMIDLALERTGAKKLFLLGHSMGGAVVVHYLVRRQSHSALKGVILSATPARVEKTPSVKIKLGIGSVLKAIVPKLAMGNGLDPKGISTISSEVDDYNNDPLVHDRISAALGLSITSDGEQNLRDAGRIKAPVLFYCGTKDPLVNPDDTRALHGAASSKDKTLEEFAGKFHEVHSENDETQKKLYKLVGDWIEERQ